MAALAESEAARQEREDAVAELAAAQDAYQEAIGPLYDDIETLHDKIVADKLRIAETWVAFEEALAAIELWNLHVISIAERGANIISRFPAAFLSADQHLAELDRIKSALPVAQVLNIGKDEIPRSPVREALAHEGLVRQRHQNLIDRQNGNAMGNVAAQIRRAWIGQ